MHIRLTLIPKKPFSGCRRSLLNKEIAIENEPCIDQKDDQVSHAIIAAKDRDAFMDPGLGEGQYIPRLLWSSKVHLQGYLIPDTKPNQRTRCGIQAHLDEFTGLCKYRACAVVRTFFCKWRAVNNNCPAHAAIVVLQSGLQGTYY